MSLKFVFGPSGSGKSRNLYEDIIKRAGENPGKNFFIIVPDQFTMQTQKDLVTMNERGGIMNIDVLSFGRLGHRILEEVGCEDIPVLDDTGKSLVLQRIAAGMLDKLPVLGGHLHKQGYIHEVKSAISEFMQYGISPTDMKGLIEHAENRGALVGKLKDLETLYIGFTDYIKGNFITTEEKLDVLRRSLHKSALLPGSVVVFDGFTGFTPIQYRVMQELMTLCDEVIIVLSLGEGEDPYKQDADQSLFHLSKKTVADLTKLCTEASVERGEDVFALPKEGKHRFVNAPALQYLEKSLFRYGVYKYEKQQDEISIFETTTPRDEVRQAGLKIKEMIRDKGYAYRDIAVIVGNLEAYAPYVETEFAQMEIPVFIDRTRGLVLNPMVEYIRSALELYVKDFSYDAGFHYLKSGLADLTPDETDAFENYVLKTGIRGYRAYSRRLARKAANEAEEEEMLLLEGIRERFMSQISMLEMQGKEPVKDYVNKLYDFITANHVQQKLAEMEKSFRDVGDSVREKEYAQIYRLIMTLLEQIYDLLGEEEITLSEFVDILEAGIGEIEVGTIPQNVDRVVVGDMERTRLKPVKALFFMGVNDGNIPKNTSKGGIISDMDREFLQESGTELAPTPRQQMYIQRLYLYLNMTKPSDRLILSYSRLDNKSNSIKPAYLIDTLKKIFPGITVEYPELDNPLDQIVTAKEGAGFLAKGFREYVGGINREQEKDFFTLYQAYGDEGLRQEREFLEKAAFKRYEESGLSAVVARALYGVNLEASISRLETYAACAYRHFLQYGLSLKEREEFDLDFSDLGNVYHAVLEKFAVKLKENHYTWFDFPEEFGEKAVDETLQEIAAEYKETILYSNARNAYAIERMSRILKTTVKNLQRQLRKGSFHPKHYELSFRYAEGLDSIQMTLSPEEKIRLQGRIDRIDVAEDEDHVYVKVVDYKSGDKRFDLAALYYGLQLQLVVYMNAAMELEKKENPGKEIVPAALLYYHVEDPTIEAKKELTDEEINALIAKELCTTGVVNSDPYVVDKLDSEMEESSDVIPVSKTKNGFRASQSVLNREQLGVISDYVSGKITEIGKDILAGNINLNPYESGKHTACEYCSFKRVCGFEASMPGCRTRQLQAMGTEETFEKMQEYLDRNVEGETNGG